jgi:hypothetical protein
MLTKHLKAVANEENGLRSIQRVLVVGPQSVEKGSVTEFPAVSGQQGRAWSTGRHKQVEFNTRQFSPVSYIKFSPLDLVAKILQNASEALHAQIRGTIVHIEEGNPSRSEFFFCHGANKAGRIG